MITLGIETSCDETALCLLETHTPKLVKEKTDIISNKNNHKWIDHVLTDKNANIFEYRILGNIIHSQVEIHREYGGVFPNLAKREHIKNLPILFEKIKKDAGVSEDKIDAIAVTQGPGLEPALWTGITFAQELSKRLNIPVIPINHMEGHIVSTLLSSSRPHSHFEKNRPLNFPALAILISGGHTEIVKVDAPSDVKEVKNKMDNKSDNMVNAIGTYKILGRTKDDAVGEAFDKVARMLGLPYPGGPEIGKMAESARKENLSKTISLPRPMIDSKDLNMSFSGLKTAVLYTIKKIVEKTDNDEIKDKDEIIEDKHKEITSEKESIKIDSQIIKEISREFENAVTEVLIVKTRKALDEALGHHDFQVLIVGGGVIANSHIRQAFEVLVKEYNIPLYLPAIGLTGDNALMIALAGALHNKIYTIDKENRKEKLKAKDPMNIKALGNLSLESQ
ncbi:MAG TPA: tRNA (adenosine(37)-N6)-threonylcarbamoyltransferase complex transferase subunit TsaD [Candidatus Paceibacterota bacterium]